MIGEGERYVGWVEKARVHLVRWGSRRSAVVQHPREVPNLIVHRRERVFSRRGSPHPPQHVRGDGHGFSVVLHRTQGHARLEAFEQHRAPLLVEFQQPGDAVPVEETQRPGFRRELGVFGEGELQDGRRGVGAEGGG